MAYLFDDGSNEYLTNANAVVSGYPVSMGCWFNSNDDTIGQTVLSITDTAGTTELWAVLLAGNVAGDFVRFRSRAGGSNSDAISTVGFTANTWCHCLGVGTNATDRKIYVDGGNVGTNITSSTPAGLDTTSIGINVRSDLVQPLSGLVAEAAIWNINLTAVEAAILAAGYSPLFVRPQNLVAYWPIVRELNDRVGGFNLTAVNGPAVSSHPAIIHPSGLWVPHRAAVVPSGNAGIMTTNTGFWGATF